MTVAELFDCFLAFFNKIMYYDETNDIKDCIVLKDVKKEEYYNFKDKYGSFEVIKWYFDNHNNDIAIDIKWCKGTNSDCKECWNRPLG